MTILLLQCMEPLKMKSIPSKAEWKDGEKPILMILLEILDSSELETLRHLSYMNQKIALLFNQVGSIILTPAIARFLTDFSV